MQQLTEKQFKIFAKWLTDNKIEFTCPACKNTGFAPAGIAYVWYPTQEITKRETGNTIDLDNPLLMLSCTKCTYIAQFSAREIGLFPDALPPRK